MFSGLAPRLIIATAIAALTLLAPATGLAAEFTVTTTADGIACGSPCTLRGAIIKAEEVGGSNTITVPAGHYLFDPAQELNATTTGELRLTNGPGTTLTIRGAGSGSTVIDQGKHASGAENDRVVAVTGGGTDVLEGLTIEHGSQHEDEPKSFSEVDTTGAGILLIGGELTLTRVRVTENANNGAGGGIAVRGGGRLKLEDSEVDHNHTSVGGGGGVALEPGTLTATDSTIDHDTSAAGQGGALNVTSTSIAALTNVTISDDGNLESSATYEGGGIFTDGTVHLTNVTFHNNMAVGNNSGGGDLEDEGTSPVTFKNVLLDAPVGGEPGETACTGEGVGGVPSWADEGGNLAADTSCALAAADMGRQLKLGELGDHGGPTPTVSLLEGSPAIDFGVSGCPASDQRGQARAGNCDSGAFEFVPKPPVVSETPKPPPVVPTQSQKAADEVLLGCTGKQLVLNDVYIHANRVLISGGAAKSLAGKKVSILFNKTRKVATATIQPNGLFTTTAPLPPARIRNLLTTRYTAALGTLRSLNLKLTRRLLLEPPTSAGTTVTLSGQVTLPLTKPAAPLIVEQEIECGKPIVVKRLTPPASGRFRITLTLPAGTNAAIFRLKSSVAANRHSLKHGFTTYSLPLPVALVSPS